MSKFTSAQNQLTINMNDSLKSRNTLLFVKDVPLWIGKLEFIDYFKEIGSIHRYSEQKVQVRHYQYSSQTSAKNVIFELKNTFSSAFILNLPSISIKNRILNISVILGKPSKRLKKNKTFKVFIGNLP